MYSPFHRHTHGVSLRLFIKGQFISQEHLNSQTFVAVAPRAHRRTGLLPLLTFLIFVLDKNNRMYILIGSGIRY